MVPCRPRVSQGGGVPAGGPAATAPGGTGGHPGPACRGPGQRVLPQLPAAILPGRPPLDGLEGPLGSGGELAGRYPERVAFPLSSSYSLNATVHGNSLHKCLLLPNLSLEMFSESQTAI